MEKDLIFFGEQGLAFAIDLVFVPTIILIAFSE